jgi:predicted 2-oxoglutarate/Fe(II)-dependent dioxygenase YbiX
MFTKFIQNFLTKEECEQLIQIGQSIQMIEMKSTLIVNGKIVEQNTTYDGNKRMGNYLVDELLEHPLLKEISDRVITISNQLNPFNGIEYTKISKYSFNRYSKDDFLDWHPDKHEIMNGATTTFIIQLNDDYENGEIKYRIGEIEHSVPKETGSVFIFDSNIEHSVDKITNGLRYSINVWPSSQKKNSLI